MIFLFFLPLIVIFALVLIKYHWNRRNLYVAAQKYAGPVALPFIGNALQFYCNNEEILDRLSRMCANYVNEPFRFWLGPELVIGFTDSNHVEKVLSSNKLHYKHKIYDYMKMVLGEGLIGASGPTYKIHKRIIQPMFNLKYCVENLPILQKHLDICIKNLDKKVDGDYFDVNEVIHSCSVDLIGEVILGYQINAQKKENEEYIQAMIDIYDIAFTRIIKPWLHPDVIYNHTKHRQEFDRAMELIESFMNQVTATSWARRKLFSNDENLKPKPIVDQIADCMEQQPDLMTNKDLVSHLLTLYAASEDTIAIISSFACLCFGMYPEYQKKAVKEIFEVCGEQPRPLTYDDISKLTYLDMCIKDVLRLAPIGPYILRQSLEDQLIGDCYVPKDAAVMVPIFNLHRNPKYWDNPLHFHPDHFLPEVVKARPVYVYLPFSAGARGCIGKIFANIALKMVVCAILQRYEIEAEGKFPDIQLRMDISVRPLQGYNIKIKKRACYK